VKRVSKLYCGNCPIVGVNRDKELIDGACSVDLAAGEMVPKDRDGVGCLAPHSEGNPAFYRKGEQMYRSKRIASGATYTC